MADWSVELRSRLASFALSPPNELRIIEELSRHLDDRVDELRNAGATEEAARRLALAEVSEDELRCGGWGNVPRRTAAVMAPGAPARGRWLSSLWQDIRYALVSLRRTPTFALTVVGALALTIGPTTAILSVGNWILWRPAPGVAQPNRLAVVLFGEWLDNGGVSPRRVSALNLTDLENASGAIAGIAGWQESSVSVVADGAPPRQAGSGHSDVNFFALLGVRPAAGRAFTDDDDRPPYGAPVVMLSDAMARGLFGASDAAVGKPVTVNGRRLSVVGVMPPDFVGARPFERVDVWLPSLTYYHVRYFDEAYMASRAGRANDGVFYTFAVRLAAGATAESLQAELDVLVPSLANRHPNENGEFKTVRARVYPGLGPHELQREQFGGLVRNLLMVGGVLLLLGCANVANLLISRGITRQRERAVRVALGASRRRLVQLLLIESCLLAVAGASIGVGLAVWLKQLMQSLLLPGAASAGVDVVVSMDSRVLAATLGVSLVCGIVAGLIPAWVGSSSRIGAVLGRGGPRSSVGGSRIRVGLAAGQLALSLALVTNAMLLGATLRNLSAIDVGFEPHGVSVFYVPLADHGYTPQRARAYDQQLLQRLSSDPALRAASLSGGHPPRSTFGVRILDPQGDGKTTISVGQESVTDGYFDLLAVPLVRGRTFTPLEVNSVSASNGTPVVLGQTLARRLFGDGDPLGQRVRVPPTFGEAAHELVVIGVVRDVRGPARLMSDQPDRTDLMTYVPFLYGGREPETRPVVMVRSDRPIHQVTAIVQAHATALDPSLPLSPPRMLTDVLAEQLARQRVFAWVLSLLGVTGFVLAAIGLYGLLGQMVSERTRELGIRMALGADRAHVMGIVLKQAMWIAVIGSVVGLGLAVFGSRMVETQLFGLTRLDPWVYATSALALAAVVLAASVRPARLATRIEPVEALRME